MRDNKIEEIIGILDKYEQKLEEKRLFASGIIRKVIISPSVFGKNEKDVYELIGTDATLLRIATKILALVNSNKDYDHYHIDGIGSGIENYSLPLIITKINDEKKLNQIIEKAIKENREILKKGNDST